METRQERGLQLAETQRIVHVGSEWVVPSATGSGKYKVNLTEKPARCSCPDYELRGVKCKHMFAVEFFIENKSARTVTKDANTTTITETTTVTKRVTYSQNWPAYNAAQTNEKARFQELLRDLCGSITEPSGTFGRPRLPLKDMVFATTFKIYSTVSGRRFISDLTDAHSKGYISKVPHFNSIFNYLEADGLTDILRSMIEVSGLPLKAIETDFAVDSTGFSTGQFVRWFNVKYGHEQNNRECLKVHLMTGTKTNIVTSVEITGQNDADTVQFPALVTTTAKNWDVSEVSADKAYSSIKNLKLVDGIGAVPYIPFKSHTTGKGDGCQLWKQAWHYYNLNRPAFLDHYHKRSNVESTVAMIKAKFGERIRSKSDTAKVNELLCKILCHNICVLIQSIYELGIDPQFSEGIMGIMPKPAGELIRLS